MEQMGDGWREGEGEATTITREGKSVLNQRE